MTHLAASSSSASSDLASAADAARANRMAACLAMETLLAIEPRALQGSWNVGRLEGAADGADQAVADLARLSPQLPAADRFFFALALRDFWPEAPNLQRNLPDADKAPARLARAKTACSRISAAFGAAEKAALKGLDCSRPEAFGFLSLDFAVGSFAGPAPAPAACPCPRLRRAAQLQGFHHLETLKIERKGDFAIDPNQARVRERGLVRLDAREELKGAAQPAAPLAWPTTKLPPLAFWIPPLAKMTMRMREHMFFRSRQALDAGLKADRLPWRLSVMSFVEMSSCNPGLSDKADGWRFVRSRWGDKTVADLVESEGRASAMLPWLIQAFAGRPAQLVEETQKMANAFAKKSDFWKPKSHPQAVLAEAVAGLHNLFSLPKTAPAQIAQAARLFSSWGFKADGSAPQSARAKFSDARPTPLFHWVDCPPEFIRELAPLAVADGADLDALASNGQTALARLNARARSIARRSPQDGAAFDAPLQALVDLGANPLLIVPAPNALSVAATPAMASLVKAHMEKEELVRELSEAQLRQAIDFWRANQPVEDQPKPAAPRRRL